MKILRYIDQLSWIKSIIKYHFEHNSGLNLPYHNFYHGLVVTSSCIEAADFYNLEWNDVELLIAAALFHDFNHSGGKEKDDWNVIKAKKAFITWNLINKKFNDEDKSKILEIIDATQYPYVINHFDLNYLQQIIRDADLTQLFKEGRIQQNYLGLGQEMNSDIKSVLEGTLKFIETINPCTSWFKPKWDIEKPKIIKEVRTLLSVF